MAKTQKSYRLGGRLPRYTTKLNAFANGMYLSNHIIPEGFVKAMVNYDIDDTGSYIRPKAGRVKLQDVAQSNTVTLGPVTLNDYIYTYNSDMTVVEDTKDVVFSYGLYTNLLDIIPERLFETTPEYRFLGAYDEHINETLYDEKGEVITPGTTTSTVHTSLWALYYDETLNTFKPVINQDGGTFRARTIKDAHAFNKPFKGPVGRPIGTVLENEIITYTGSRVVYNHYPNNPEKDEVSNIDYYNLSKLVISKGANTNDYYLKIQNIDLYKPSIVGATNIGFNLLLSNPDVFEDRSGGVLTNLGNVAYKTGTNYTKVNVNPSLGDNVDIRTYYQYPTTGQQVQTKLEVLDSLTTNANWEIIHDWGTVNFNTGDKIVFPNILIKYAVQFIRITIRSGDDTATETSQLLIINTKRSDYTNLDFTDAKWDFNTCKGMFTWLGAVGFYGVKGAENVLFLSTDDPGYVPDKNVITFSNEVLAVYNYLNYLLVITIDSLWLLIPGATIMGTVQKCVLSNIYISEIDAVNVVILKDQIFFKTDNQFYVLKPNMYGSDATDLKNYTNSTALVNYMADFQNETVRLLNDVYKPIWQKYTQERRKQIRFEDFDVLDLHSALRNEEVHYIYTIVPKLTDDIVLGNLNLHLVYNTLTRSWRMYFVAVGDDTVAYAPVLYKNKDSGAFYEFFAHPVDNMNSVVSVTKLTYDVVTDNFKYGDWNLTTEYDNFTFIDTGNIAIDDVFTKRFREVQFNIMNLEPTRLKFYTNFRVDGRDIIDATNYVIQHITDTEDPDYGKIFVTPIETDNMFVPSTTILANETTEFNHWSVDLSKFPELSVTTVRFTLQGRGRRGQLQLLNTSLERYELSNINWVYRSMSAR